MDYFLLNECIFKEIIKNQKIFILSFLKSLNIDLKDYKLFEINSKNPNSKLDILLFSSNYVINIQLNKREISLKRNKVYFNTLKSLLPAYKVSQININLFENNSHNEYLKFITSKNYNNFKTKNPVILEVITFLNTLEKTKYLNKITKEEQIKSKLDNLITD